MPDVYSRTVPSGERVWYADCYYWEGTKRKRKRRSTGIADDGSAKSRRTAEIVGRDIEQSLALGAGRVARPTTAQQAIAQLIANMGVAGRSQSTIDIVTEKGVHLVAHFGKRPLAELGDADLEQYAREHLAARKGATVERELRTLRQAMKAAKIPPPKMPKIGKSEPRERFLDHAETLRLLAAVNPKRRDYIVMYRHMGLRKSELARIEAPDCDFTRREVRVRGTKTDSADRVIPMSADVYAVLMARRARVPMFDPWEQGNAARDLYLAAEKAGLGPISFNDLRRSFATELAASGTPILHLMHLMGHTSTRMLESIYARVGTGQHMHKAIAALRPLKAVRKAPRSGKRA